MKYPFLALALLSLGCKSPLPAWLSVPDPITKDGVQVVVDGVVRGSTWISGVTGTAQNLSGGPFSRCSISFDAYGMHGVLVGTARAERDGLGVGETWEFRAKFAGRVGDAKTLSSPKVIATP